MPIPLSENIVSLADAAKLLPRRRGGKRPHVSCVYRWTNSGCKGIVLESTQVGATRCTSTEALERFFQRLSGDDGQAHAAGLSPSPRPSPRRAKEISTAAEELAAAGI